MHLLYFWFKVFKINFIYIGPFTMSISTENILTLKREVKMWNKQWEAGKWQTHVEIVTYTKYSNKYNVANVEFVTSYEKYILVKFRLHRVKCYHTCLTLNDLETWYGINRLSRSRRLLSTTFISFPLLFTLAFQRDIFTVVNNCMRCSFMQRTRVFICFQ